MKFVSWNVNGLRACIQKGFQNAFDDFNADFFCLQETKLSEGQLQLDLPGYEQYWCYAEKKGYSGTAIFTKHTPLQVSYGIGRPELDHEGRVITLEYREFYLVNCYTPNAQRGLARIGHRMAWDEAFRDYLSGLDHKKPVILCGDLNVAHKEIDLKNPSSNRGNAGFSDQERNSFQQTLNLGFTDTFRYLYPDATGRYSWWSYMFHARENNAGWRIDYFLVSDRLKDSIYRADIHSEILGSDHCPVSLELDTLVNGGIWSPEWFRSRPAEPEPETKKTTEPSSVSKKGIATIITCFLILSLGLFAVLLYPGVVPGPDISPAESPFQITPFYTPLKLQSYFYGTSDGMLTDNIGRYGIVASESELFYIRDMTGLDSSNVFFRITPKDSTMQITADDWNIAFLDLNTETRLDNLASTAFFNIQPYYSGVDMQTVLGYLVWCRTTSFDIRPVNVQISDIRNNIQYVDATTLAPYLTQADVKGYSTEKLLLYMAAHPDIFGAITAAAPGSGLEDYEVDDGDSAVQTALQALIQKYPAVQSFFNRTDRIDVLMNVVTERKIFNQKLLYASLRLYFMSPQQEYKFLTGQYPAGEEYIFPDEPYDPLASTENVMWKAFGNHVGQWLQECTTLISRSLVYEYARERDPWVKAFEERSDCISILMNTDRFTGLYITDQIHYTAMDLVPHHLLSLTVYREKMTPLQEAQFLTGNYNAYPSLGVISPGSTDACGYDTDVLIDHVILYSLGNMLEQCSTEEAMYYVCLYTAKTDPALAELMAREDAIPHLRNLQTDQLYRQKYRLLLLALTYDPKNTDEPAID